MGSAKRCSIPGCMQPFRAKGWCIGHYSRNARYGDPLGEAPKVKTGPSTEERFWDKVAKSDACWRWTAHCDPNGYGQFQTDVKLGYAHRYSWELANGSIPDGMYLDHICRNTSCVNPSHLRLASPKQNAENTKLNSNNTSGYRGVSFDKRRRKWVVYVSHHGRHIYGGQYDTRLEAGIAARDLRNELFTHNILDRKDVA